MAGNNPRRSRGGWAYPDAGRAAISSRALGTEFILATCARSNRAPTDRGRTTTAGLNAPPYYGTSARLFVSSTTLATNSATGITVCLFPAPRTRTATVFDSISRAPTTPIYGTFITSPWRIR